MATTLPPRKPGEQRVTLSDGRTKEELEAAALDERRRKSFQEESEVLLERVLARENELKTIRERIMFGMLPQSARDLPPGEDIREVSETAKLVNQIDVLIEFCEMRRKYIHEKLEHRYTNTSDWGSASFWRNFMKGNSDDPNQAR